MKELAFAVLLISFGLSCNAIADKPNQIDLYIIGGIGINFECINMENRPINVHWQVYFNGILYEFSDSGDFIADAGTAVTKHYSLTGFGIVKASLSANGINIEREGILLWIFVIFVD